MQGREKLLRPIQSARWTEPTIFRINCEQTNVSTNAFQTQISSADRPFIKPFLILFIKLCCKVATVATVLRIHTVFDFNLQWVPFNAKVANEKTCTKRRSCPLVTRLRLFHYKANSCPDKTLNIRGNKTILYEEVIYICCLKRSFQLKFQRKYEILINENKNCLKYIDMAVIATRFLTQTG